MFGWTGSGNIVHVSGVSAGATAPDSPDVIDHMRKEFGRSVADTMAFPLPIFGAQQREVPPPINMLVR